MAGDTNCWAWVMALGASRRKFAAENAAWEIWEELPRWQHAWNVFSLRHRRALYMYLSFFFSLLLFSSCTSPLTFRLILVSLDRFALVLSSLSPFLQTNRSSIQHWRYGIEPQTAIRLTSTKPMNLSTWDQQSCALVLAFPRFHREIFLKQTLKLSSDLCSWLKPGSAVSTTVCSKRWWVNTFMRVRLQLTPWDHLSCAVAQNSNIIELRQQPAGSSLTPFHIPLCVSSLPQL